MSKEPVRAVAFAAGAALAVAAASAGAATSLEPIVQVEEGVNFLGGVVGRVPEFAGALDTAAGIAPMARWQLRGERFVQLLGTELTLNVLDHPRWRWGPSLGVRLGRREVSDPVVRQLQPVPSTAELGAFLAYSEPLGADPRQRLGFNLSAAGSTAGAYGGLYGAASVYYLKPVAPWLTLNLNAGIGVAGSGFVRTYFGVSETDAGLFPSLAGAAYRPDGGVTDVRLVAGGLLHLSPQWHVVAGARVQRLLGDAADSPIVRERGRATQWIAGAGLVYMWR